MKSTYLALTLMTMSFCNAAKRPPARNIEIPEKKPGTSQTVRGPQQSCPANSIYVPLWAITPDTTSAATHERTLFLAIMAIAGIVGKIMLDPNNTISVIEQVTSMIDNLAFAADVTNCTSGRSDKKSMIEALAKYIQDQAQLIIASQDNQSKSNEETKSAHDKLVEYALFGSNTADSCN